MFFGRFVLVFEIFIIGVIFWDKVLFLKFFLKRKCVILKEYLLIYIKLIIYLFIFFLNVSFNGRVLKIE